MNRQWLRVCLTGSECTGKTTLARTLGECFGAPWLPEAARLFAEQYPGALGPHTVQPIAELHLSLEHRVMAMAQALEAAAAETPCACASSRSRAAETPAQNFKPEISNSEIQNPKSKIQNLLFLDADLLSTVVYARHYYGGCPPWIEIEARRRRADLYLLCACDIPWHADGIRDLASERDVVQAQFRATLEEFHCSYVEIGGTLEARIEATAAALAACGGA